MQDFWEESSRGSSQNLTALNQALVNVGSTLPEAYHEAAIALAFNQSCCGDYQAPYCLEEGPDYVSTISAPAKHGAIPTTDSSYNGSIQDNYALNWITLPTDAGRYNLVLENTAVSGQFRASAVCDTGTTLRISPFPEAVGSGQATMLTAFNSDDCNTAIAVITNQNQTDANPTFCTPRSYQLTTNSEALPYMLYFPLFYLAP
jgi:hypothetical protein